MTGPDSPRQGLIQVYTGSGKGKTTCALGLALRAVGRGWRVKIIQFMKAPASSGEHFSAPKLAPNLEIVPAGRAGFIFKKDPDPEDIRLAQAGLEAASKALEGGQIDLLIIDESMSPSRWACSSWTMLWLSWTSVPPQLSWS